MVDDRNPTGYAQVVEESLGASEPAVNVVYTYGLDLVKQRLLDGTERFYGYDGLGSVRYLTSTGEGAPVSVTDTYDYDAFGILINPTASTTPNNYRFTGEQWDPHLGMYYLRARYYKPEIGRFWTMDSYEGSQGDPLSLHKYLYAQADPINRIDPSGHFSIFKFTQKFGYEAHRVIQAQYLAENPGAIVGPTTGVLGTRLKPNILNTAKGTFGEIKPLSLSGVAAGMVQIEAYQLAFNALGVPYAKETWPNGVREAYVFTTPIAYFNVGGVIFYTDEVSNLDDLFKIGTYALAREFIRRGLVKRTLQSALIRIPGLVVAGKTADTGRLQMHLGIATILSAMGKF